MSWRRGFVSDHRSIPGKALLPEPGHRSGWSVHRRADSGARMARPSRGRRRVGEAKRKSTKAFDWRTDTMPKLDPNVVHHPAVLEQFEKRTSDLQLRIADKITAFAGSMNFV